MIDAIREWLREQDYFGFTFLCYDDCRAVREFAEGEGGRMIWLNYTGTNRTYWMPTFKRRSDGEGLWFITIQWLRLEIHAYSHIVAVEFIRRFNEGNKALAKADGPAGGGA